MPNHAIAEGTAACAERFASLPTVSTVLVGMRKPSYVDDVLQLLPRPRRDDAGAALKRLEIDEGS